jgi:hypothetical protein
MNNVIELATATISSFLDVQAQLLVQLERLQPAVPKCSECGDNRTDLSLYCSPCLNSDGWYQLSTDEASRIESAQPVVPKSVAWQAGYNAGLAMAEAWRDDAVQHAGQGEAWKHDCSALLTNDIELWINSCPHCGKPRPQPAVPEDITKDLNHLYWSAYHAGHHDTVEGCYRDVYAVDRFDYWEDRVSECIDGGDMPAVKALLSAGKEK